MALESASYINGLVSSNPAAGDPVTQADDHMRLIKAALLATFPNITGPVTATHTELNQTDGVTLVTPTGTETLTNKTLTSPAINTPTVVGGTINDTTIGGTTPDAGAFTTLAASGAVSFLPAGIGVLWYGSSLAVPTGWYLCDGTNGTPDMRGFFPRGASGTTTGATGGSNDAVVVSHTHTATVTDPGHTHSTLFQSCNNIAAGGGRELLAGGTEPLANATDTYVSAAGSTGITVANSTTGVSGTNANIPPYKEWHFIMRA